jgi:hypothetical protein
LLVLYHLRTFEPFGDRLTELTTKDVSEALSISQRTVQRAIVKLHDLELIDLEIRSFAFKVRTQHATRMTDSDTHVAPTSPVSLKRHPCRASVTHVAPASPVSKTQLETFTNQEFQIPHTIHTYSDLKDTTEGGNCCVLEKFEERLKIHGIHLYIFDENSEVKNLAGFGIAPNPKVTEIQKIIKGMPPEKAERAIAAFLAWLPNAKNVRCKYAAFASSLRDNWES